MKNSIVKYVKKCPEHPKPLNELQGQMENKRVCKQVIYTMTIYEPTWL